MLLSPIYLKSEADTERFAQEIAATLRGGETIALIGQLGAGKTTFTRYLTQILGSTTPVSSPTFVLAHEYEGGRFKIEHWDLYRLGAAPEEVFEPPKSNVIRLIEWADKDPAIRPDITIRFKLIDELREVTVERST